MPKQRIYATEKVDRVAGYPSAFVWLSNQLNIAPLKLRELIKTEVNEDSVTHTLTLQISLHCNSEEYIHILAHPNPEV